MSSLTELPCPYCGAPVALRLSQFYPRRRILCPSCSRVSHYSFQARVYYLGTLVLFGLIAVLALREVGFNESRDFGWVFLQGLVFFVLCYLGGHVSSLVLRRVATLVADRRGGWYAPTTAPSTRSLGLMLAAGLNGLLYLATWLAAFATGESVSRAEGLRARHVLFGQGSYVKVSPALDAWLTIHGGLTLGLLVLAFVVVSHRAWQSRKRSQGPPAFRAF